MTIAADALTILKRAGGLEVYYGGEAPASAMTASDKTWQQI